MTVKNRIGEISYNNQGLKMEIIDYRKYNDIDVEFEDGYIAKNKSYSAFEKNNIKNPYFKSVYGIGYIGNAKTKIKGKKKKAYECWRSMLGRCYDKRFHEKSPSYKDCKVCEEWLSFENYEKWHNENYYEIEEEKMHLDKDILVKGNKLYSPETCVFVPQRINAIFTNKKKNDNLPRGVYWDKFNKKYIASLHTKDGANQLGYYKTAEEAHQVYLKARKTYLKQLADMYKNFISDRLYEVLYNYNFDTID